MCKEDRNMLFSQLDRDFVIKFLPLFVAQMIAITNVHVFDTSRLLGASTYVRTPFGGQGVPG